MTKSRNFCYTFNNYQDSDTQRLQAIPARYHVQGFEEGESKTPHIQGFIMFKHQRSVRMVMKLLKGAHVEVTRGTPDQAATYCKKDGEFWEQGDPPVSKKAQGEMEKQRWRNIITAAESGNLDEIKEEEPRIFIAYHRTLERIASKVQKKTPPLDAPCGVWIWGPAGVGKTTRARAEGDSTDMFLKSCNKWWDGYASQDLVVMDDLDTNHACLAHHLKLWADKWAFPAEIKGSCITIRPKKFVVTSQFSPEQIFQEPQALAAIRRRFKVIHIENPFDH